VVKLGCPRLRSMCALTSSSKRVIPPPPKQHARRLGRSETKRGGRDQPPQPSLRALNTFSTAGRAMPSNTSSCGRDPTPLRRTEMEKTHDWLIERLRERTATNFFYRLWFSKILADWGD